MREYAAVLLLILLLSVGVGLAQTAKPISLEWDNPNETADDVIEYVLYQAQASSGPWAAVATIPVAQGRIVSRELTVDSGRHWFYVTARNRFAESGPSNTISVLTDKPRAVIIRIK